MEKLMKKTQLTSDMQDGDALTFGYVNEDGAPAIREGVDDHPTIVEMSTPYMTIMLRNAATHVFHFDTTYKIDQAGYPVLVIGVLDQTRSFNAVATLMTSQQTGGLINTALQTLFDVFKMIAGDYPEIRYCMADADKALDNAVMDITSSKRSNDALTY
ncbi:MULE transposase domain-containing protein [Phytophthora infestans]|uniref:MULE transposase domain-containing protein n=1 Tax=Phytophthora infestans TaxID=4787 RepID=A0A833SEZ8_PHYIN|nr:MULE transposase domain-containing protein [Phytophthora infestans]